MEDKPYAAMDEKSRKLLLKRLNKSEEDLTKATKTIKEWVKTQKHFPEIPTDSMINFSIVLSVFELEAAKQSIDMYYTIRTEMPDLFKLSYPLSDSMIETLDFTQIYPLPKLNVEEHVIVIRMKNPSVPSGFDSNSWLAAIMNINEVLMQESLLLNCSVIYDYEHLSLAHMFYITPTFIRNCAKIIENFFRDKINHIHVINYPPIFQLILTLCKPILKPELYEKFRLHDSIESLTEFVPLEMLPKDYGGNEKTLDELEWAWKEKLYDCKDRFEKMDNFKIDESLRQTPRTKEPEGLFSGISKLIFH